MNILGVGRYCKILIEEVDRVKDARETMEAEPGGNKFVVEKIHK